MTEVSLNLPSAGSVAETPRETGGRELFLTSDARRQTVFSTLRERLCWPLGIYTTPVVVLIAWEVLARAGVVS
ncbi:ABC transporter permease, partial [Streptomyces sp. NPDC001286]